MKKVYFHILESIIKNKLEIRQYPYFVTFLITWRCNAKCSFCDIWKKEVNISEELALSEIEKIFRQLKSLDVLRITGGEPFLRDDLAEVVNIIDEINRPAIIHLTTNGILTERILRTVKKIKSLEKLHIKISIDNIGEKHSKHRGVPNAYEKAKATVEGLAKMRNKNNFHIGVNHAVLGEKEINTFFKLKEEFNKIGVPVYAGIAVESQSMGVYSDKLLCDPTLHAFRSFSKDGLRKAMGILLEQQSGSRDFAEKVLDRYNLEGLYNRLIEKKNLPNPRCVALNNHLRLMPNGDVIVCLANGAVVGNLRQQKFKDVWFGEEVKKQRNWIKKCPGCWHTCETDVSAIYTGDIWKGLFY